MGRFGSGIIRRGEQHLNKKDFVLDVMRRQGRAMAFDLQGRAPSMAGTELVAEDSYLPEFQAAKDVQNMLSRPVGVVCKSAAGRVVRLIQPYDSDVYMGEPEDLPAQWGFVWSTDPRKALPFIAMSTSPYMAGDCCTEKGAAYRSKIDNNTHSPSEYPRGWECC